MQSLNIKEWKQYELQITLTRHPLRISNGIMSKFNIRKMRKYLSNVHNIGGTHFQCMNNYQAKFEYKGMKQLLLEFQITQTRHPKSVADR